MPTGNATATALGLRSSLGPKPSVARRLVVAHVRVHWFHPTGGDLFRRKFPDVLHRNLTNKINIAVYK